MAESLTRRELLALGGCAIALSQMTAYLSQAASPEGQTPVKASGDLTLRERADRKGLLCGTAVPAEILPNNPQLHEALRQDCNILVPENELKMGRLQRERNGKLDFGPAEQIYAFAQANNMRMRGHALSWWGSQPPWLAAEVESMSASAAGDFLTRYVTEVATHWRGRLAQWDVVNEPITAKDDLQDTVMSGKLGERFIDIAFHAAQDADPDTLRVLNATLIAQDNWWEEHQQAATLRLLERLLARGVPVQALGYEAHMTTASTLSEDKWRRFLDEVTGMGLKIMITEFDINDRGTIGDVAKRDAAVAALTTQFLDITLSYPNCLGLLTWGQVDRYTWLRKVPKEARADGALLRPSPRDDDFQRKPMWHAIANAIDRAEPRLTA